MEAIRNGVTYNSGAQQRSYPILDEKLLKDRADYAAKQVGMKFYLSDDVYKYESDGEYGTVFIEEQGKESTLSIAFIDISIGTADPWSVQWLDLATPEDVARCALPGQTLEFSGSGLWAVYIGDGECVYAKAEPDSLTGVITQTSVADMMQGNHCHLQINDYMVVSPAVQKLLDPNDI